MNQQFLPTSLAEGRSYYPSFTQFDVVFVTGDPYYDHPLSGMAIIARLLDSKGYKIGIIAQPESEQEYKACGRPKYFFCITSGLLDSMLANYTPMLKKREHLRVPERALMVYTQNVKKHFSGIMTVIGGVEATIRRFTHFDYKDNTLRRGILNDTKADALLFGNAERSILTLLSRMKAMNMRTHAFDKIRPHLDLGTVDGTAFRIKKNEIDHKIRKLPGYEECVKDKQKFNLLTRIHWLVPDDAFIEPCGVGLIRHNRPNHTLREEEMDVIYGLPYTRMVHPASKDYSMNQSMVEKLKNSVPIGRGCWGSCNFCIIPLVQGKEVATRSVNSTVREIDALYARGEKKINDLTLPTLNMYGSRCSLYDEQETIFSPVVDKNISVFNKTKYCNQQCVGCEYRVISDNLYPLLVEIEKINSKYNTTLELRSAVRHDIILNQKKLFRKIMEFTTRLKIAPEHVSDQVLKHMNKSTQSAFTEFLIEFRNINTEQHTRKRLVPYLVAAHPGSTSKDMEDLQEYCKKHDLFISLTQVFTPTPGTVSTAMYYSGENPITREAVHVPRTFREKKDQKNILFSEEQEFVDDNG